MKASRCIFTLALLSTLTLSLTVTRADLVHHWSLDEVTGLVTSDRTCNADGDLGGFDGGDDAHWVAGEVNGGLDLGSDGILDNRVVANLKDVAAGANGFTVCMWINPGDQILNPGEYQLLSTPGDAVGFTIMNDARELVHDRVLLFWDGSLPNLHVGTTTLEPGTWYHVAITSAGIGGDKLYYVNGALEPQALFQPSQGGTQDFHPATRDGWAGGPGNIGNFGGPGDASRGHDSVIDEVRIYDNVLTLEEIQAVMGDTPGLAPTIENVSPDDGNAGHTAADGVAFDVVANEPGATLPVAGIKLFLNDVDVSDQLDVAGTETNREVLFEGLEENQAYQARIEVTDSEGSPACRSFAFGTIQDGVPGLVHYFTMDETAGLLALDSGSVRNGTLIGFENDDDGQWIQGICDNALDLGADGTVNNYVEFTANAVSAFDTGGFTVAMWLNPGPQILTQAEYQLMSTPGDQMGFTIMNNNVELRHDRVLLFWDGSLPNLHVGTTTLEPGTWYHVAITSTGAGGEKLYYINGELEEQTLYQPSQGGTEGFHPGTQDGWAEGIARLGAINAGGRAHDSILDDVRIYNRALDEEEILAVRDECDPLICNPLDLADLSPQEGDSFHDATAGIEFEVSTPNTGFGIEAAGIQLILNGTDVSGDLTIGGNATTRTVTYDGLVANTAYALELSVTDECSTLQRAFSFGTFVPCTDEDPTLRHYWKLDEGAGLGALDCVGGALGSLIGFGEDDAQWVDAIVDGGLDFGADDTLNNAIEARVSAMSATETGGFTVAMWINPGEQIRNPGEYQLFAAPGGIGFTIMNDSRELVHDRVLLFWDGSLPDLHVGTTILEPGTWYHVAITSTGPGGEKIYYVNGELEPQALFQPSLGGTQDFHPGTSDGWGEGVARLGAFFGIQGRNHDTIYDEIRIYDRDLSLEEIAELTGSDPGDTVGPFVRGDCNGDGSRNITDGVFLLNFLFLGGTRPKCSAACDNNGDGEVPATPTDALSLFNFLFLGGAPLPEPLDACGVSSRTEDLGLGCLDDSGCNPI